MSIASRLLPVALAGLFASACATQSLERSPAPVASAPATRPAAPASGPHMMVAAANPMAVDAGLAVLKRGGSAVDAAVAVQAVLGLVEPQSSGLGGGSFMAYYDAKTRTVTAYNGREVAPAGATPDMFMADGKPMTFPQAVLSGRSAGVPGAIAMLHLAQSQHGKLPWSTLFGDAERLADGGFPVPNRMAMSIASHAPQNSAPDVIGYFTRPDGAPYRQGDILKNPAYAATVRKIAAEGPAALLQGQIAQDIVTRLHEGPIPSSMTLKDLASYRPKAGPALCRPFRVYVICTPQAPSGGPSLLEGLGLLERTDIADHGPADPQGWYLFSQASRLMYADRDRYMGDPDFVTVPVEGLLDPVYLAERAKLIGPTAGPAPAPGHPKGAPVVGADKTLEPGGTTHMVIVDAEGNAVSMTTTVESIFGDGRMVDGFFLNNQLTDFSFSPRDPDGAPAANAVAPGKRPRSAMSPAIVLDRQGRLVALVGSPGGPAILAYNLKALIAMLDWKLPVQDAIALPNLIARGDSYGAEVEKFAPGVVEALAARNVHLAPGNGAEGSGLHGIQVTPNGLVGGADPRRDGVAKGN